MSDMVFVSGASGFVGTHVVNELLSRGYRVSALVRSRPIRVPSPEGALRTTKGDVFDRNALLEALTGCTAAIHLIGIIMEYPRRQITFRRMHVEATAAVLEAVTSCKIRRYVHMSALGTRPDAIAMYHQTKWEAEQLVRSSGLDWTILRPSMIHGPDGDFTRMQASWARGTSAPWFFMPYFGSGLLGRGGAGLLQPIYVRDVARAFVDCLSNEKTIRQTYELAGPETFTWEQLHRITARAITGIEPRVFPIPAWYARTIAAITPRGWLPFNTSQVQMSQEDNTAPIDPFVRDFGWTPGKFETTLQSYAHELKPEA
jgi:NADH dehydrogenase